jgi:L-fucose isomerase-like protein
LRNKVLNATKQVKPINSTTVAVLPIGEFDTDFIKKEFDEMISVWSRLNVNLIVADALSNERLAPHSVQALTDHHPDLLLIVTLRGLCAQLIEAVALLVDMPVLIWPVQGRFALPSSALAVGALREAKVPVELIYAPADHPDAANRLDPILKAAKAYTRLRKSRIGVVGNLFSNLVSCRYDAQTIRSRMGITLVPISFDRIRRSIQSPAEYTPALDELRQETIRSYRVDTADRTALDSGLTLHLVLKQIAMEQNLAGFATECWSAFPRELGMNPCMGFIEDAYELACEGDVMLCIALLFVRYMNDIRAYVGDLYDLDLDGVLTLIHCGAPASLASPKNSMVLSKSQLALERGFQTMTCRPRLEVGPVTVFRFYGQECNQLHLAAGELIHCEQSPNLTVKVKIGAHRLDFLDQCFGNHYLVVSGDIRNELKLLCKWLGITIFET